MRPFPDATARDILTRRASEGALRTCPEIASSWKNTTLACASGWYALRAPNAWHRVVPRLLVPSSLSTGCKKTGRSPGLRNRYGTNGAASGGRSLGPDLPSAQIRALTMPHPRKAVLTSARKQPAPPSRCLTLPGGRTIIEARGTRSICSSSLSPRGGVG